MKLINDFFEIVASDKSEGALKCQVRFDPTHFIYAAHFPGNPVTPGVCLIQIAGEILEKECDKTLLLSTIKNIKFKKIVVPEDTPFYTFNNILIEGDQLSADVMISDEHSEYVKMSLLFKIQS